jgi:hypothetical protein
MFIDGQLVVDNDGLHGAQERSGTVRLAAGTHVLRVVYFNGVGSRSLGASWQGPGIAKQAIPDGSLFRN